MPPVTEARAASVERVIEHEHLDRQVRREVVVAEEGGDRAARDRLPD